VSKPHLRVLALWSLGRVLARSGALTAGSACLAPWLQCQDNPVRPRWREVCYAAPAKRGKARHAVVVATGVAPRWAGVLSLWQGTQLARAREATTLGDRVTVLGIRVGYRGCAIPIAWTVLTAQVEKAWRPAGLRLLQQGSGAVPPTWRGSVRAERGW